MRLTGWEDRLKTSVHQILRIVLLPDILSLSIRDELWVKCFKLYHGRLRTGATPMFEGLGQTRLCSIGNTEIDMGLLLSKVLIYFLRLISTNDYFQAGEQLKGTDIPREDSQFSLRDFFVV